MRTCLVFVLSLLLGVLGVFDLEPPSLAQQAA